jgi:hypothetical protein
MYAVMFRRDFTLSTWGRVRFFADGMGVLKCEL